MRVLTSGIVEPLAGGLDPAGCQGVMGRLTVVSVAYPLAPVGPNATGGAEQVLTAIDRALVAAGHRSIIVAVEGSISTGELAAFPAPGKTRIFDEIAVTQQRRRAAARLREVIADEAVDLVHMHGVDFDEYLPPPGPPVLATLHLPLAWYNSSALHPTRPRTWLNCVSASQEAGALPNTRLLAHIGNGVPVADLGALRLRKRDYALMLARVCPEKGQHLALEAARAADATLLIGGEVFPYAAHQDYFAQQVRPLLDRRRRFLGPLDYARKRILLAGASCLLIPSLAAETSSLVAMEAASCGTPVVAFRTGALPELIENGRSGFLVDDAASMGAAIRQVQEIEPEACRSMARARFGIEKMTEAYLDRYAALVRSSALPAA